MRSDTKSISSGPMLVACAFSHGEVGGLICSWRLQGAGEEEEIITRRKKLLSVKTIFVAFLLKVH